MTFPVRLARTVQGLGLLAFLVVLFAAGCVQEPPKAAAAKPPQVIVGKPVVQSVTDYEDFTGRTEAVAMVQLRARVTGYLDKVPFKEGADVKQGDLLFEIDPRIYQAELDRAKAGVDQAEAHLERLKQDARRAVALLARRAISQEEAERMTGDRTEAEAALSAAVANWELAKLNLSFTRVTAPISGRISRAYVDPGNLVKADDTILTSIVSLDPIYAYFDIDERTLLALRRLVHSGTIPSARETDVTVQVGLADEEGYSHTGTINFADNRVDPGTGTLRVRAVIANTDRFLSPGLFVRVRVPIGTPHPATLVPEEALGTDQGQKFLYVVNDRNEVEYRRVKVGLLENGLRVVSGVKPQERIVVSGLQRVRPGITVEPKPAETAAQ